MRKVKRKFNGEKNGSNWYAIVLAASFDGKKLVAESDMIFLPQDIYEQLEEGMEIEFAE